MTTYDRAQAIKIIRAQQMANASTIYDEAATVGLQLPAACALMAKESSGRNVYGHDAGGALSGYPGPVDSSSFGVFWWLVSTKGQTSNGVGPSQITAHSLLADMLAKGLKPWVVADNMRYGFGLLLGYYQAARTAGDLHPWVTAGTRYNGNVTYGKDLAARVKAWHDLLTPAALP